MKKHHLFSLTTLDKSWKKLFVWILQNCIYKLVKHSSSIVFDLLVVISTIYGSIHFSKLYTLIKILLNRNWRKNEYCLFFVSEVLFALWVSICFNVVVNSSYTHHIHDPLICFIGLIEIYLVYSSSKPCKLERESRKIVSLAAFRFYPHNISNIICIGNVK